MSDATSPRLTFALLILVVVLGVANLGLFALTQQVMLLVTGVIFIAAGTVNLRRLKAASR